MPALVNGSSGFLLRLESACRALADARTVQEVKDIRDKAQAIHHYTKQRDYSFDAQQDAAELKLRAERKLGELLAKDGERRGKGKKFHNGTSSNGGGAMPLPEGINRGQSHRFQRVASLPEPDFERHIATTRERREELTTAGVVRLAKEAVKPRARPVAADTCTVADLTTLVHAGKTFGCIYADPPWKYSNQATRAATDTVYQTMTVEEICALPVGQLAAKDCHLHLWTTNAFLFECPKIFEAWGFEYKSAFVWVKPQMGIGNYWRLAHEFLLLGVRGRAPFADRGLMSWAKLERGEHSVKPEPVRRMIEKASPGPRLEMFGRQVAEGWTVWGNEIKRSMFDHVIKAV